MKIVYANVGSWIVSCVAGITLASSPGDFTLSTSPQGEPYFPICSDLCIANAGFIAAGNHQFTLLPPIVETSGGCECSLLPESESEAFSECFLTGTPHAKVRGKIKGPSTKRVLPEPPSTCKTVIFTLITTEATVCGEGQAGEWHRWDNNTCAFTPAGLVLMWAQLPGPCVGECEETGGG